MRPLTIKGRMDPQRDAEDQHSMSRYGSQLNRSKAVLTASVQCTIAGKRFPVGAALHTHGRLALLHYLRMQIMAAIHSRLSLADNMGAVN